MTDAWSNQRSNIHVLSYEESKRLARDPDVSVRTALAKRGDIRPEVLYFLAQDESPEVRREIAANGRTPDQADLLLARDLDEPVRQALAVKVANLIPDSDDEQQARAQEFIVQTLEALARDSAIRVRQILSETLKSMTAAPLQVIRSLAHDVEDLVACPVLEYSPCLSDEDLLEIINNGCASGHLKAISRRETVSVDICDAILDTDDESAIESLLTNSSAQIREEALNELVDRAPHVLSWHRPLVDRGDLPRSAVRKLTAFIADSLLMRLQSRLSLDEETAQIVADEVHRRIGVGEESREAEAERARKLFADGKLTEDYLLSTLDQTRNDFVKEALALLTGEPRDVVERIISSRSAKGMTALSWKADLSMRAAMSLQRKLARIMPGQILNARNGSEYPLSEEELEWQWAFFQSLPN